MAKKKDRIRVILTDAEKRLMALIAEWATKGDLAGVDAARSTVAQIRAINSSSAAISSDPDGPSRKGKLRSHAASTRQKNVPSEGKQKYPHFEVRNGTLYRIGWSKKKNECYTHKVPRARVLEIVNTMTTLSDSRRGLFSAEEIILRVNAGASVSIPNYQAYAAIGFLRSRGLVKQVGRDGYQIPNGLSNMFQTVWNTVEAD